MFNNKLRTREDAGGIPPPAACARSAVGTYVRAWRQLCDAMWQDELEDPLFGRAVELVEAGQPGPGPDAPWLQREAWRDCIRSWWFSVRDCYASPAEIPQDWIVVQREWEPERELASTAERTRTVCSERRAATWARVEALIETGDYWPLHLDAPHLVRAQFETLRHWAPAAVSEHAAASQ
jgi:hypothetical protein